jgi:hypothetical protein
VEQRQGGHHLGDLGQPEQPLKADDLDRDVGAGERVEHVGRVRVVAGEDPDLPPRRPRHRPMRGEHLGGEPGQLVVVPLVHRHPHGPGLGARLRLERKDQPRPCVERGREVVGGLQDPGIGAPVDAQWVGRDVP